jgi:hypothetical protein
MDTVPNISARTEFPIPYIDKIVKLGYCLSSISLKCIELLGSECNFCMLIKSNLEKDSRKSVCEEWVYEAESFFLFCFPEV